MRPTCRALGELRNDGPRLFRGHWIARCLSGNHKHLSGTANRGALQSMASVASSTHQHLRGAQLDRIAPSVLFLDSGRAHPSGAKHHSGAGWLVRKAASPSALGQQVVIPGYRSAKGSSRTQVQLQFSTRTRTTPRAIIRGGTSRRNGIRAKARINQGMCNVSCSLARSAVAITRF
jgi:hypothetical protein